MSSVQEITVAIQKLSPAEREELTRCLPALLPELDGEAAWERMIRDPRPRLALSALIDQVQAKHPPGSIDFPRDLRNRIQSPLVTSRGTADFWRLYRELPQIFNRPLAWLIASFVKIPLIPACGWSDGEQTRALGQYDCPLNYRAVAFRQGEEWIWIWIGDHKEFNRRFPA